MTTLDRLLETVRHPGACTAQSLADIRMLRLRHPESGFLTMLYLEHLFFLEDPSFQKELSRLALLLPDPMLFWKRTRGALSLSSTPSLDKAAETKDSTLSLIDSFLESTDDAFGTDLETQYSSDYIRLMEPSSSALPSDEQIDRVIEGIGKTLQRKPSSAHGNASDASEPDDGTTEVPSPYEEDEGPQDCFLTETLAHIYIKQKRYDKALEILKRIRLINPKKSAYFADQIRFLEKLIINNKTK